LKANRIIINFKANRIQLINIKYKVDELISQNRKLRNYYFYVFQEKDKVIIRTYTQAKIKALVRKYDLTPEGVFKFKLKLLDKGYKMV